MEPVSRNGWGSNKWASQRLRETGSSGSGFSQRLTGTGFPEAGFSRSA